MRTTADLNRIIDKIAETNPARLNASTTARDEFQSRKEKETETTPRQFVPRLAADADTLASTAPTAPGRPAARREKTEKNGKELKTANIDAATTAKQRDDETKRTQRSRQIDPTTCERD